MEIANLEILLGIDMSDFTDGVNDANNFARAATAQIQAGFQRMATGVEGAVRAANAAVGGIIGAVERARRDAVAGLVTLVAGAKAALAGGIERVVNDTKAQFGRLAAIVDSVKESFSAALMRLVAAARAVVTYFYAIGRDMVLGLIEGLKASIGGSVEAVRAWVGGLAQTARNALGIKSPSRVFYDMAQNVVWGFRDGIRDNGGQASAEVEKWLLDMVEAANKRIRLDIQFRIQASKLKLEAQEIILEAEKWTAGRGALNLATDSLFGTAAGGAAGALRGVRLPGVLQEKAAEESFLDVWRKGLNDFALEPVEVMRELGSVIEKAPERFGAALQAAVEGLSLKDVGLPDTSFPILPSMLNDEIPTRMLTALEETPLNIDLQGLPLVIDSSFKLDDKVLEAPVKGAALAWVDVIEDIGPGLADLSLQAFEPPIILWGNVLNEGVEGFKPALQGLVDEVDGASLSFVEQISAFEPPLILWGNVLDAALEPTKELAEKGLPGLLEAVEAVTPALDDLLKEVLTEPEKLPQIGFTPLPGQTDIDGQPLAPDTTPGWLSFLLAPLAQFASLLDAINPVAALVAGVMEVLGPAVETLVMPFTILGQLLATALLPILQLLFPLFKIAALAVAGFAMIILEAWNVLAAVIKFVTFGLIDLAVDTKVLSDGIKDLVDLTWDEADARRQNLSTLEQLNNIPDIFKINAARFKAQDPVKGGIGTMPVFGTIRPLPPQSGGGTINVQIVSDDPDVIWRKLEPYFRRRAFVRTGNSTAGAF